jgi:nicotinamidase-related amidase
VSTHDREHVGSSGSTYPVETRSGSAPVDRVARSVLTDLIEVQDSVLVVIDVQDQFLTKVEPTTAEAVVERIRWLVQVAGWFEVPVIVTAEDTPKLGPTTERIRSVLPAAAPDLNKVVFGLADQSDILQAVESSGRRTAILVGLETDVCVQHSALGLARRGYNVAVVIDATASPGSGYQIGLDRMRAAGVAMVSCKSIFFEWSRNVEAIYEFADASGIKLPDGLTL